MKCIHIRQEHRVLYLRTCENSISYTWELVSSSKSHDMTTLCVACAYVPPHSPLYFLSSLFMEPKSHHLDYSVWPSPSRPAWLLLHTARAHAYQHTCFLDLYVGARTPYSGTTACVAIMLLTELSPSLTLENAS